MHHESAKTHCKNGHPYSGENLVLRISNGYRKRHCRICLKASQRRYARSNAGKVPVAKILSNRSYRQANRERVNAAARDYYARNREAVKARQKEYRARVGRYSGQNGVAKLLKTWGFRTEKSPDRVAHRGSLA